MADLAISTAIPGDGSRIVSKLIATGQTIAIGDSIAYAFDSNVEKAYLADATTADGKYLVRGMAITAGTAGSYVAVVEKGPVVVDATLDEGEAYGQSAAAGQLAPGGDFSGYTSATQCHIGYATSTTTLYVNPFLTGAVT